MECSERRPARRQFPDLPREHNRPSWRRLSAVCGQHPERSCSALPVIVCVGTCNPRQGQTLRRQSSRIDRAEARRRVGPPWSCGAWGAEILVTRGARHTDGFQGDPGKKHQIRHRRSRQLVQMKSESLRPDPFFLHPVQAQILSPSLRGRIVGQAPMSRGLMPRARGTLVEPWFSSRKSPLFRSLSG